MTMNHRQVGTAIPPPNPTCLRKKPSVDLELDCVLVKSTESTTLKTFHGLVTLGIRRTEVIWWRHPRV